MTHGMTIGHASWPAQRSDTRLQARYRDVTSAVTGVANAQVRPPVESRAPKSEQNPSKDRYAGCENDHGTCAPRAPAGEHVPARDDRSVVAGDPGQPHDRQRPG